jgi:hypothetical protein
MSGGGVKPCAACGAPVADVALGRGALENPDGRRYCSPCAAQMLKANRPAAPASGAAPAKPAKPGTVPRPPTPAAKPGTAAKSPQPAVKPPAPAPVAEAPAPVAKAPVPAPQPAPSAPAAPAKKESVRQPPAQKPMAFPIAPARKPTSVRVEPAKRPTSARVVPAKKPSSAVKLNGKNGGGPSSSSRISKRLSARGRAPWYLRLTRNQIIGLAAGAGGLLLLIIVGVAVGTRRPRPAPPPVYTRHYDSRAQQLIAEADALYLSGNKEGALAKLRQAAEEARAAGQDGLAVEANRKIYGINKSTPVSSQ